MNKIDGRRIAPKTIFPWHFHDTVWKAIKERLKVTVRTEVSAGRVIGEEPEKISEKTFKTKYKFVSGTTAVFLNGIRLKRGYDYTEGIDGQSIRLTDDYPDVSATEVQVDYDKKKNKILGIF